MRFAFYALFFYLLLAGNLFANDLKLSCDSNGNLTGIDDLKFTQDKKKETQSLIEAECSKLGSCLLDYPKFQTLNDNIVSVLTNLVHSFNDYDKGNEINRLMTLKEARYQCETIQQGLVLSRDLIKLSYPYKSLNTNKSSSNYDFKKIENLLEIALREGADPLLALGILIVENPPLVSKDLANESLLYEKFYGTIPVDNVAVYDYLGCQATSKSAFKADKKNQEYISSKLKIAEISKVMNKYKNQEAADLIRDHIIAQDENAIYDPEASPMKSCIVAKLSEKFCKEHLDLVTKAIQYRTLSKKTADIFEKFPKENRDALTCYFDEECKGIIKASKSIKQISLVPDNLKANGKNIRFCKLSSKYDHGGVADFEESTNPPDNSCCVDVVMGEKNSPDFMLANLKNIVGLNFLKSKIKPANLNDLSLSIQTFNGLGCLGCTEKLTRKGSCLDGLDMKKTPIYGARVGDLITNMLMKNPIIMKKIKELSLKINKPIKSIFCNKAGDVQLSDQFFLSLQKKILLENGEDRAKMCLPFFK